MIAIQVKNLVKILVIMGCVLGSIQFICDFIVDCNNEQIAHTSK